jgi:hypothetical protein
MRKSYFSLAVDGQPQQQDALSPDSVCAHLPTDSAQQSIVLAEGLTQD